MRHARRLCRAAFALERGRSRNNLRLVGFRLAPRGERPKIRRLHAQEGRVLGHSRPGAGRCGVRRLQVAIEPHRPRSHVPDRAGREAQDRGARDRERDARGDRHRANRRSGERADRHADGRLQLRGEEGAGDREDRSAAVRRGRRARAGELRRREGGRRPRRGAAARRRARAQAGEVALRPGPRLRRRAPDRGDERRGGGRADGGREGDAPAAERGAAPGAGEPLVHEHHLADRRRRDLAQRRRRSDGGRVAPGSGPLHDRRGPQEDAGPHERGRGRRGAPPAGHGLVVHRRRVPGTALQGEDLRRSATPRRRSRTSSPTTR